ncbi:MAG: hypothetical protein EBU81_06935 [Proteobacteria bacterium]|nr:hypothetical protein [Pseudomonadota bacterium]
MAPVQPVHANFKEAYCHHHGCSPAGFERHLLLRIIPLPFRPLAAVSFWMSPELFASELEVIRNAAPARTGREVNAAAQDLVHLRFVENSFRRSLGMRGRSEAVVEAWNAVKATVDRPANPDHPSVGFADGASHLTAASRADALGRTDSALTLRTLRKIHGNLRSGSPLDQVLKSEGLTVDQVRDLVDRNRNGFDGWADLRDRLSRATPSHGGGTPPKAGPPLRSTTLS